MRSVPVNGEAIRERRKSLPWTQEMLAEQADCDVKTVRKAEKSGHVDPSIVLRLAAALGIKQQDLLDNGALDREQANIEVALASLDGFNRRDPDAIASCFHDEGSISVLFETKFPGGGEFQGKDAIRQWAEITFQAMLTEQITPDMYRVDAVGEFVFIRTVREIEVTSLANQITVHAQVAHEFRILDGKIISQRMFPDTAALTQLIEESDEQYGDKEDLEP